MTKIQNSKPVWVIGYWNLKFLNTIIPGIISLKIIFLLGIVLLSFIQEYLSAFVASQRFKVWVCLNKSLTP